MFDVFVGVVLGGFVLFEFLFVGFEVVSVDFTKWFYGEFEAAAFVCAWFSDYGHVEDGFFFPSFFDFDCDGVAEGYAGGEDEGRADVVQWEVETGACAVYDLSDLFGEDF